MAVDPDFDWKSEFWQAWLAEPCTGERASMIDARFSPPEPQLLDTCLVQNLNSVDYTLPKFRSGDQWTLEDERKLETHFGKELAADLLDAGILYKKFEFDSQTYPWLVCQTTIRELSRRRGPGRTEPLRMSEFLQGFYEDVQYTGDSEWPELDFRRLQDGVSTTNSRGRLRLFGVQTFRQLCRSRGPLYFLGDQGDREILGYAMVCNIPAILTTDRRTFWRHQQRIKKLGIQVFRPVELLPFYERLWCAWSREFARRQGRHFGPLHNRETEDTNGSP